MNAIGPRRVAAASLLALAMACGGGDGDRTLVRVASLQLRFGGLPAARDGGTRLDPAALDALGGFETVALPDYWAFARRRRGLDGWYRGRIELADAPSDWAIAVDGSWASLQLFVNGERLLDSTAADRPWPVPLFGSGTAMVSVPRALLRAGANEIALHYETRPDEIGTLYALELGPSAALARAQRQTLIWTTTVPRLLALVGLACGVLVLMLARWSVTDGTIWLGLGTALWSAAAVFAPLASSSSSLFGVALATAAHAFPPCIAIGFLRALGLERRRTEALLLASIVAGTLLRVRVAPIWIPVVDNLWWLFCLGIGIYVLPLAARSVARSVVPLPRLVLAAAAIIVGAGIVDFTSLFAGHSLFGFSVFAATSPLIGLATAAGLVAALSRALEDARTLNTELERRVDEKRRELDASYARTAVLERDRAIAAERARMMRDMHDGTGGQLVSALAMVEGGDAPREAVAEALREALSDLRLVIDSLEPGDTDLLALLAHARSRVEPRLERHGARFAWEVADVPTPERFGPEQSLHVLRIFQEAVTNALKHGRAKTITVRTGTSRDAAGRRSIHVEIADDGVGLAPAATRGAREGRGLANMQRRAEELGGTCAVERSDAGTTVRLSIPAR